MREKKKVDRSVTLVSLVENVFQLPELDDWS